MDSKIICRQLLIDIWYCHYLLSDINGKACVYNKYIRLIPGVFEQTPQCFHNKLALRWRHNGLYSVSDHQPHDCLLNRLFRRSSKKTSKLCVTGFCAGNSPGPVNSPHKWPVTRKMFPFDDVIMDHQSWITQETCNFQESKFKCSMSLIIINLIDIDNLSYLLVAIWIWWYHLWQKMTIASCYLTASAVW